MRAFLPSLLSLLIFPAALALDTFIERRDGFIYVTVSNAPPCIKLESSIDLSKWRGRTAVANETNIDSFLFIVPLDDQKAFWRVVPGSCSSLLP
jgi:hypothetical protein